MDAIDIQDIEKIAAESISSGLPAIVIRVNLSLSIGSFDRLVVTAGREVVLSKKYQCDKVFKTVYSIAYSSPTVSQRLVKVAL